MPNVRMPNGDIVAFPDTMPKEQIRGMIAAKFPDVAPEAPKAPKAENEQTFGEGMKLGLKKRALGVMELGANAADALGVSPESTKYIKQLMGDVGQDYQREGTGTGFKGAVAEIAGDPLSWLPAAGTAKIIGQGALMGATAPTGDENSSLLSNAQNAAGGAAASIVGMGAGKVLSRVARPVNQQLGKAGQAAVKTLEKAGVNLTAGQKTGSKALASLESVFANLPTTSAKQGQIYQEQAKGFTKAALGKAGIKAEDAGRKVISDAADMFGQEYQALAANNVMKIDKPLNKAISDIQMKAGSGRMGADAASVVKSVIKDIRKAGGAVSGNVYHETRKMLTQKANSTKDAFDAGLMKDLRNALDSAFDRSLPASQRGALAEINTRYQSFKPIQKAMESSKTEVLRSGMIDPTALYQQVNVGAPLSDLADAGAALLRPTIPDSGTAQRILLQNALTGAGVAGVAGGASMDSDLSPWMIAGGLALAGPRAAQMGYNSKIAQNYLTKGLGKTVQKGADAVAGALPRAAASGYSGNIENDSNATPAPIAPTPPASQPSTFNTAVNFVLNEEGGYVADDAGKGETNMGINKTANPDLDIRKLTPEAATARYKTHYWDKINGDRLPPALAMVAFDGAVNQGVFRTKALLKKSGGDPMKLLQLRKAHYDYLVKKDPKKFGKHYNGWMSRLNKLAEQIGG